MRMWAVTRERESFDVVFQTLSQDEAAEDAAWNWIQECGWVPTPELLFAMKELIRQQMMGG